MATQQQSISSAPYAVLSRKERSRELAQKRRTTYKSLMKDLADELPFSKDVISQVDYNSRLRLALCFFRMKSLAPKKDRDQSKDNQPSISMHNSLLQDLLTESLDGFIIAILGDGTILYVSESIHKHLGLFQSEHIGSSFYDLIHNEDYASTQESILKAGGCIQSDPKAPVECSFFCRMKCSRFKVSNAAPKSPGHKLVYVSGHFKYHQTDSCLFAVVRPISPPSVLEITLEGNMFVTHYNLEMKCIFFDGRLKHLMGYEKQDLINKLPFEMHHHDDVEPNLECSRGLMQRGEGLSGYYRYMNKFGEYVWMQSRATMMFDTKSGLPSYIVCMNFVISREKGEKSLELRKQATNLIDKSTTYSHDPFPVSRSDGRKVEPFITELENDKENDKPNKNRSISPESVTSGYYSIANESVKSSSITSPLSVAESVFITDNESTGSPGSVMNTSISPLPMVAPEIKQEHQSPNCGKELLSLLKNEAMPQKEPIITAISPDCMQYYTPDMQYHHHLNPFTSQYHSDVQIQPQTSWISQSLPTQTIYHAPNAGSYVPLYISGGPSQQISNSFVGEFTAMQILPQIPPTTYHNFGEILPVLNPEDIQF